MTQAAYGNLPAGFRSPKPIGFTASNGTVAKILVEQIPASLANGSLPPYYGGCTLLDLTATSTDAASKDVILYVGTVLTTQDATNSGNLTNASTSTITRATGSFISDGWQIGDLLMVFTPFGTAQVATGIDGIPLIVTNVSALVLTFNGTPLPVGPNILTAGTRLVAVSDKARVTVAANAGNSSSIPNVRLLANPAFDASVVTTELKLGAENVLIAAMQSAVSALPAQVKLLPSIGRY
jgi:hypothetical protein